MKNRMNAWKAGIVGVCILGAIAVPTAVSAAATDDVGPRLAAACARVPKLTIRTENALDRLAADASTRGSLAWLQAGIDRAEAAGRSQVVIVLENRLAVRTARVGVLEQRLEALGDIAAICAEKGA